MPISRIFLGLAVVAGVIACGEREAPVDEAYDAAIEAVADANAHEQDEAGPDESLHEFFERIEEERRKDNPQAMARALAGSEREEEYLGRLNIPSVEREKAELDMARRHREELRAFEHLDLEKQDRLSVDILAWQLDQKLRGEAFMWHDFPVNQLMAIHNMLPGFMTGQHPLRNERDIDFYMDRLDQFPEAFQGTVDIVEHRVEQGIMPPRFAVEKTIRDSLAFIDGPASENPLVTEILDRVQREDVVSDDRLESLETELAEAVGRSVVPAYRSLIDYLESLLDKAESNDGVWRLPEGDAYYRWLLRGHTTTDMGPDEIHELGLSEVERISAEMDEILCARDYCEGSVGERMAALNAEERFLFEDSDEGREQILEAYREIVAEIEQGLDDWFHDGPTADIEVRRVPEYREATAFGAYYMRPDPDGSRPGIFFANLRSVDEHPRFGLRTLAYHESIPGHHLQITRMQAMEDVPEFRRTISLHAHAEGWALYAEYLAWEMGFHEDPYDNLGRLQAELFRAVRLVVDTGMHHRRWSRERAIDYMQSITGMPMSDVVAEIERYLVIPGQACAFKVGMIRMLAMRERARDALGDDFDIRDFHRVILDNGAMPLELLDRVVDDWLEEELRA